MRALRTTTIIAVLLVLAGCGYNTQTTSGHDWLAAEPAPKGLPTTDIDARVRQAAAVEPTLRFPARIGIARIEHGSLSPIPAGEAQVWTESAGRLGEAYGEFVPVSPLIAAMFNEQNVSHRISVRDTLESIRLAAARQHLDAVLIYEIDATADIHDNPLSIADWTLIGAFVLPGRDVKAYGAAQAMLLDVRNGYPYGTVQAHADDNTVSQAFGSRDASEKLADKVRAAAVVNLVTETESMLRKLRPELAALDRKKK
ncbi:MAG TPA: hypothetical protein VGG48_20160 [Rhizomicrobium sp.]|jgi:hypothetical protein